MDRERAKPQKHTLKMTIKRKYFSEDLLAAVKLLREGTKMKNVAARYPSIPDRNMYYRRGQINPPDIIAIFRTKLKKGQIENPFLYLLLKSRTN